jgi:hypothetical protein
VVTAIPDGGGQKYPGQGDAWHVVQSKSVQLRTTLKNDCPLESSTSMLGPTPQ